MSMTSNQTADDQAEEVEAQPFEYTLAGADRPITLSKPNDAQMAVLVRLDSMLEESPLAGVQLYMDAIGALMDHEDEQYCLRMLLRGKVELEAFASLARETLFHYYPDMKRQYEERERTSKQHGPAATRRPRRR